MFPEPRIVPSSTFSEAIGWPSFAAASSRRMWRTSAAACWTAGAQPGIDCEPAVVPSLGTMAVSPETILIRSMLTSSSSAQTCATAVRMPWPSSTLPTMSVTLPSALMRSQALRLGTDLRSPASFGGDCASGMSSGIAKERVSEPRLWRRWRRLSANGLFMAQASLAARSTARTIRLWDPQRQRLASSAERTSPSVGLGLRSSNACAWRIMPDAQ